MLRTLITSVLLLSLVESALGNAFIHPSMERKNSLSIGAFYQASDVVIKSSSNRDRSVGINLAALGLDIRDTTASIGYRRRLSPRVSIYFNYYSDTASASRLLETEVNFKDRIYDVGVLLDTEYKTKTLAARLTYDYYQTPNSALSVGFGLHAIQLESSFSGDARLQGFPIASPQVTTDDLLAPLPNFIFTGRHAFNDRLLLRMSAGWLSFNIDDYKGKILLAEVEVDYRITRSTSVAFAYNFNKIDVNHFERFFESNYNLVQDGPLFMIKWAF